MRRLVSSPDAVGNLTFQDTEVPTPKANECLIRVKAFSMNRGELKRSQNDPLGTPIAWDVVGVVEQTAQDGSGSPIGTKIVALSIRSYGVHTSIGRKGFNRLIPHKSPNFGQLEILFLPLILELGQRN